ncbi:MAG: SEL1-like repeat protein [Bryobacteraceae bacterium]
MGDDLLEQYRASPSAYRPSYFRSKATQFNLGVAYYFGEGMALDYSQAARWFRKAAEQVGRPTSCCKWNMDRYIKTVISISQESKWQ